MRFAMTRWRGPADMDYLQRWGSGMYDMRSVRIYDGARWIGSVPAQSCPVLAIEGEWPTRTVIADLDSCLNLQADPSLRFPLGMMLNKLQDLPASSTVLLRLYDPTAPAAPAP